jgi:sec-independent protein translocase protein TatC
VTQQRAAAQPKAPPVSHESDNSDAGTPMTFWEHLDELRKRLIWCIVAFFGSCIGAWYFYDPLLQVLVKPFKDAWLARALPGTPTLNFDAPAAAFMAIFKLSMLGGVVLSAPIIFYQLWSFVAPGLYAREKRFVIPFVVFSSLLFAGGCYFGWRAAVPFMFSYFLSFAGQIGDQGVTITPTIMMGPYIDFLVQTLFGFGIIFELPLLLLFLSIAGIINYLHLIRFGRWFVLVSFIVAAILTPPDITMQLTMAVPMCVLYFVSIGLAYLFGKPPTEAQREAFRKRKQKPSE